MTRLDPKDENICSYAGLFGILIAITCLIQHMVYGLAVWLLFAILIGYLLVALIFALLAIKKWFAPFSLIVACVLTALVEVVHVFTGVVSPVSILLFIYSIVITVYLFMEGMPAKLRRFAAAKKAERDEWKEKI